MKLDLGAIMKASRVRAGLSQEEMAERIGYNQSDVSKFETELKMPAIPTFLRWFEVTNAKEVAVAYIMGMDGLSIMQSILQVVGG